MRTVLSDVRFGLRMLRKNPAFAAIAVLTLALGIGMNSAIFTVVDAVLLRPLPVPESDRLYMVWGHHPQIGNEAASLPDFTDWRAQNSVFQELAATDGESYNLSGSGEPERLIGARVTGNFFQLLRVPPVLGRVVDDADDKPGAPRVAVLSHGLWQRRFAGDAGILGKTITLNGEPTVIVGVAPAHLELPPDTELWTPLAVDPGTTGRRNDFLRVIGRLKPGVSREQATADMKTIAARLQQQYPATNANWSTELVSVHEEMVGQIRPALLALWGAVGFVLLIVCANIANLLLARGATRQREIALRAAMGAGRFRLVRQLLTESVLLALIGGVGGVLLAYWGVDLLVALAPPGTPMLDQIAVNRNVLLFAMGISVATGLLFGLAPSLHVAPGSLNHALKEGGSGTGDSRSRQLARRGLMVAEVALSLVLLVSAGLMIRSFQRLMNVDLGFDTSNLLTLRVSLPQAGYREDQQVVNFYRELDQRLAALPGVKSAAGISALYVQNSGPYLSFGIEGRPDGAPGDVQDAQVRAVSPALHATLKLPLRQGRLFSAQDREGTRQVALINETLARRYFPGESPLGKRIAFDNDDNRQPNWREIVGVIGDVAQSGLDKQPYPEIQVPEAQAAFRAITVVVRAEGSPMALAGAVREQIRALDSTLPAYAVRSMDEIVSRSVAERRFSMYLFAVFAAVALLLAAVGIYGVISYVVTQRTREIGVRMALGAQRWQILRMVLGHAMGLAILGLLLGSGAALALTRFLSKLLFGVRPTDGLTFVVVAAVLAAVALVASYVPARRAMRVDPVVALRYE